MVLDGHRLPSLADLWSIGSDGQLIAAEGQLHRILLIGGHDLSQTERLEKFFPIEWHPFQRFGRNHLTIIRIHSIHQFGDQDRRHRAFGGGFRCERGLILSEFDLHIPATLEQAGQFIDRFGGKYEIGLVVCGNLEFLFAQGQPAAIGGHQDQLVFLEADVNAVEHKPALVG